MIVILTLLMGSCGEDNSQRQEEENCAPISSGTTINTTLLGSWEIQSIETTEVFSPPCEGGSLIIFKEGDTEGVVEIEGTISFTYFIVSAEIEGNEITYSGDAIVTLDVGIPAQNEFENAFLSAMYLTDTSSVNFEIVGDILTITSEGGKVKFVKI